MVTGTGAEESVHNHATLNCSESRDSKFTDIFNLLCVNCLPQESLRHECLKDTYAG